MKVLIAEDEYPIRVQTEDLMEYWGYEFDVTKNGLEAVEMAWAKDGEYDLCLMDIDMPIMNGVEAVRRIRQKTRYFPILALSANSYIEENYLKVGFDGFLGKPWDMETLREKIRELTVKEYSVRIRKNGIRIMKETPMDQEHLRELQELHKKNLRKVKFFDTPGATVIVHKNVTNKISHDFIVAKQSLATFVNRDPEKPTKCDLYKDTHYLMPQTFLTEEEFNDLVEEEDQALEKFPNPIFSDEK